MPKGTWLPRTKLTKSILLQLNNVLEQKPMNISSYRNIVSTQCDNHMTGVNTSQMTPAEYSSWMINIIFP